MTGDRGWGTRQERDGDRARERKADHCRKSGGVAPRHVAHPPHEHGRERLGDAVGRQNDAHRAPSTRTPNSSAAMSGMTMYPPPSPIPKTRANRETAPGVPGRKSTGIADATNADINSN